MRRKFSNPALISSRRIAAAALALVLAVALSGPRLPGAFAHSSADRAGYEVHISVLGLFHPKQFVVSATPGQALVLQMDHTTEILEQSSGLQSAKVELTLQGMTLTSGPRPLPTSEIIVSGRNGGPVDLNLAIPGKITRRYHGTLEIRPSGDTLLAILKVDIESAVASVVSSESLPDTPLDALKAQAIAARSYFVSGRGRHDGFDFCDTTHCQTFRDLPVPGSLAVQAAAETQGMVLAYKNRPVTAMYTRSCSGRTRTPAELGMSSASYPYYSVDCQYCRLHPAHWTSRLPILDSAALHSSDESSRIKTVRRRGWSSVPSNDFVSKKDGGQLLLQGTGHGHGIGLCQSGAKAMALAGASYREILDHYYPNTDLISLPK